MSEQNAKSFTADTSHAEEVNMKLPGAQPPDGILAHVINADPSLGLVASIIHLTPGSSIAAHSHERFSEAHYVLEGVLVNDGVEFGPGGFITHAPGVVHGPHSSKEGCRVLTIQTGHPGPEQADHKVVGAGQG